MAIPKKLRKLLEIYGLSLLMTMILSCRTPATSLNPKVYYLDGDLKRNDNGKEVVLKVEDAKKFVCLHEDDFYEIYKQCRLKSE